MKCLWQTEIETTRKVEISSSVVDHVLAEERDLESLLYSKVFETQRDKTQSVKKRDKEKKTKVKILGNPTSKGQSKE